MGLAPRSALFLPASNQRAIAKARSLAVDLILLDLEDAVKPEDKLAARSGAVAAVAEGFGNRAAAIRVNGEDTTLHAEDMAAVRASAVELVVLPKVESAAAAAAAVRVSGKRLLAMIETPLGLLAAADITRVPGVAGLIAGTNDLSVTLGTPAGDDRTGLVLALQTVVLAARAGGIWAIDGVFNRLDDPDGLERQCIEGRRYGFDGKSLIHPTQVEIANRAFGPSDTELADAHALIAAATGGAERFEGRMVETMHVDQAKALIARAERGAGAA